jgi:hypothetical protein
LLFLLRYYLEHERQEEAPKQPRDPFEDYEIYRREHPARYFGEAK